MPLEAKEIFEAESQSLRKLLSEPGVGFYIPPYQRPYSWDRDKVNRLLEDTVHGFCQLVNNHESFTFLGTIITIHDREFASIQPIVRSDVPGKVLNLIDGQQRLTTLVLICIALHNQVRLSHARLLRPHRGKAPPSSSPDGWLDGQALQLIAALRETFVQLQPFGTARKYPKMIRAFDDQWSRSTEHALYTSPIAHLVAQYCEQYDADKPVDFKPDPRDGRIEGEDALVSRFTQIARLLRQIAVGKMTEEFDVFPDFAPMLGSPAFQKALLNHEIPLVVQDEIKTGSAKDYFLGLFRLVFFGNYCLDRVALTVVKGKNEDYAFSVFESLNTTGEPLTAFETFRPRVVSAETLGAYERSEARQQMDQVVDYLAGFKAGEPVQAATRELLVAFAAAETGEKLSKRLSDQRRYLKDEFERHEGDPAARLQFVKHLRDATHLIQYAWVGRGTQPSLHGLPVDATTDVVKLCLAFLEEAGHTVTIGPITRFFSSALSAPAAAQQSQIKALEQAIRAITAFSVLWRGSRRGTSNIDQEYRELLTGAESLTEMPPLARCLKKGAPSGATPPSVDVANLKAELIARLTSAEHGNVADKGNWVREASAIPAYTNSRPVSRMLLLAAHHDAVEDPSEPGLIIPGRPGVSPCLTFEGWKDEKHLSLEHIAPKELSTGWEGELYASKETIHRIGNLVLVPSDANSSLSNRPWFEKSILYGALGAKTKHDASSKLLAAEQDGITFSQSTQELVDLSVYIPALTSLSARMSPWSSAFIQARSERILGLAWDRFRSWLD